MALGTDLGIIGTGLAAGAFFLGLGWKADGLISKQAREDLAEYLRHYNADKTIKTVSLWPKVFREFFDKVFGEKHLSFKCFFRSSVASIVSFCICLAAVLLLIQSSLPDGEPIYMLNILADDTLDSGLALAALIVLFLVIFIIFNLPLDYVSLLETRYVIGKIEQTESVSKQIGWILFDIFATGLWFSAYTITLLMSKNIIVGDPIFYSMGLQESFLALYNQYLSLSLNNDPTFPNRVVLLTTYFTSLWVWLYFLSQILTRLVSPLSKSVRFLRYLLPINSYPLRAVCTVMAIIACVGTWIILLPTTLIG